MSSREPSGVTSSNSIVFFWWASSNYCAGRCFILCSHGWCQTILHIFQLYSITWWWTGPRLKSFPRPFGGNDRQREQYKQWRLSYVGKPFLNCDLDSAPAFDRESHNLDSILAKWPTKVADCLIPSRNSDNDCSAFYPPQTKGPLLASLMAIFTVLLTAFVGLLQRFGDMVRAII